ncbi:SEC12-like protein 1 [Dichanthelium oligosanthes]|uniref:SEC12-like protein 1 n=1 Tax=Dichanthelium oligosanthes TaxID=888268 RepID=A0A1E5VCM8_9POAL|nr:SEC12-like protein 1 [Dichanthelium oligosanthes]
MAGNGGEGAVGKVAVSYTHLDVYKRQCCAMAGNGGEGAVGKVACAAWIRRRDDDELPDVSRRLVAFGRGATASSPPLVDLLEFDAKASALASESLARVVVGEEADDTPHAIAVHPGGRELVCATAKGCRVFKLVYRDFGIHLISSDASELQSVGPQKCLTFSTDGAKFAIGGEDGHLRIFHWPSLNVILDEPKAHKSFRDMDISLDSEFLVSTSNDGSARIWKIDEGSPLRNLTRSSDEKIECCRFSKDGTKPFLFCTLVKGHNVLTMAVDISNWKRIGYKKFSAKPISTLSVSLDGKYLALGNGVGDFCVVEVKKMQVAHWSKMVHLGSPISSIEFCPTERVVISTSHKWGAEITKLDVPPEWKVWQIWLVLISLFVSSAVLFYLFFKHARINL